MSDERRPIQEDDAIPTLRIVIGLVATIVLTVVCCVWVWAVMKPFENADRQNARPTFAVRPPDVGGPSAVDRTLYNPTVPFSAALLEKKRAWLESWGWVDRGKGVVHMPIERAMKLVVVEASRGRAE
jgi:hypothetical protein